MNKQLDIESIVLLSKLFGIGSQRLLQLVPLLSSLDDLHKFSLHDWNKVKGLNPKKTLDSLNEKQNDSKLIELISRSLDFADETISYWDENYPDQLKQLYNPPPYLFCKGNIALLKKKAVGIVGSRRMTAYGKEISEEISADLASQDITIVSGFAQGIDTSAHSKAIEHSGKTIAVLGSGLNRIYPKTNANLYQKVLDNDGLIISEFLIDTKPDAMNFPKRNRIIAGLSHALIVCEAQRKSGALITAEFSLENNREVYAVPGPINSDASKGCNDLIKQGATPYLSKKEFFEDLNWAGKKVETKSTQLSLFNLSVIEEKVLECIDERVHIDQLSVNLNMPIHELSAHLLNLELKQCIVQERGQFFKRLNY